LFIVVCAEYLSSCVVFCKQNEINSQSDTVKLHDELLKKELFAFTNTASDWLVER